MNSIQVLNGPQGTLFGRSSIAGAVLFEPSRPDLNSTNGFADFKAGGMGLKEGALPGTLGCTHLNDVLRSLADVPRLIDALDAGQSS